MFCELEKCQEDSGDSDDMRMRSHLDSDASTNKLARFYDVDCIFEITRDVAKGYLILLTGGSMTLPPTTAKDNASKAVGKIVSSKLRKKKRNRNRINTHADVEQSLQQVGEEQNISRNASSDGSSPLYHGANVVPMKSVYSADFENNLSLAFMALTDGNVIDICFGVDGCGRKGSNHAKNSIREVKNSLRDAGETSDSLRHLAVGAYGRCFDAVIEYRKNLEKTSIFGYCAKAKKIRRKAEATLSDAFSPLLEALESTS